MGEEIENTLYQEVKNQMDLIDTSSLMVLYQDLTMTFTRGVQKHFDIMKECISRMKNIQTNTSSKKHNVDIGLEIELESLQYRRHFIKSLILFNDVDHEAANKIIYILQDEKILKTPEFRREFIMVQHGIQMFTQNLIKILDTGSIWKEKILSSNKRDQYLNFMKK